MIQNYKYLHIRACEEDGAITNRGGLTVAYLVSPELDAIFLHWAKCNPSDNFCYKTGREIAANRLLTDGPADVLPYQNPVTEAILNWIQFDLYGGTIDFIQEATGKKRWMSTFTSGELDND